MKHLSILDISIYQIQIFLAVAEERNFLRAATRMNLTQPTLSKRISVLEDLIGVKLFDRLKRPVELTKAGNLLYEEWKHIARLFEMSVEKALDCQKSEVKKLTVCILDSARLLKAIPVAGQKLENDYPDMDFSWEYASFMQWKGELQAGTIDIMFTMEMEKPGLDNSFDCEIVVNSPKLICMLKSNPLSQKHKITFQDLKDQNFVMISPSKFPAYQEYFRQVCAQYGVVPRISRYAPDAHALVGCLQKDNEVLMCDLFLRDIESPNIKCFEFPDIPSGLLAVWKKNNINPYIRPYLEILKNSFITHYPDIK